VHSVGFFIDFAVIAIPVSFSVIWCYFSRWKGMCDLPFLWVSWNCLL